MDIKKVSVVLPTYNEKDNIEKFTNKLLTLSKTLPYKLELIITDSHSTDGTADIAKSLAKKHTNVHYLDVERGIGVGLIKGHQYAVEKLKPDVLSQMDADGQVDVDVLPRLVDQISNGYTLVLGSRFAEGGKNELSFRRRFFTNASSVVCRILMGPWDIKEFTNSARAFTPELFKKINLKRLPWQEPTFINQPAFLNEAVIAGAKYIEVPLIFRDRAEGYSKNKTFNYTYDLLTYAIDARLIKMGLNIPFFKLSRRAKTFLKFGVVGFSGTMIDFLFYKIFINSLGVPPATSKAISTEIAIVSNFLLNNFWTFKYRKTGKSIYSRFLIYNLVSLGGLAIAVLIVKALDSYFGAGNINLFGVPVAYNNFYFFATIPPVMVWNFTMNHLVTWKNKAVE